MLKYYKIKRNIIAVDPYKKVYMGGEVDQTLACGRGVDEWGFITDQVFKISDLGKEVYPGKRKRKELEAITDVQDDYAARWLARVLVYVGVGTIILLLIQCLR
jgi:cysteine synthase